MSIRKRFNDTNRDVIFSYVEGGGAESGIELTAKQIEFLDRWKFADEKLREQKYKREQIAQFIIGKYGVSRDTAFKDIVNAEYVFSSSYPMNKRYMIGLRIEFLIKKINEAYLDNDRMGAALLERVLEKYIEKYPDYLPPRTPKQIVLNIQQNVFNINNSMTAEQAFEGSDEIIKLLKDGQDY
jgi:hypothetical protein